MLAKADKSAPYAMRARCNLLVFCINSPLHYALYDGLNLRGSWEIGGKSSSALVAMYENLRGEGIENIYYACGPGNLSALKMAHVFLHTWAMCENLGLYATDSFSLMEGEYIYAFGKKYFRKRRGGRCATKSQKVGAESKVESSGKSSAESRVDCGVDSRARVESKLDSQAMESKECSVDEIECVLCENPPKLAEFVAPKVLDIGRFSLDCEPLYMLPPV